MRIIYSMQREHFVLMVFFPTDNLALTFAFAIIFRFVNLFLSIFPAFDLDKRTNVYSCRLVCLELSKESPRKISLANELNKYHVNK